MIIVTQRTYRRTSLDLLCLCADVFQLNAVLLSLNYADSLPIKIRRALICPLKIFELAQPTLVDCYIVVNM